MWEWFLRAFRKDGTLSLSSSIEGLESEIYYKELAILTAIKLISNAVSRGEFLTYEKGKEVKKENYYLFNIEANQNKSANSFWKEVVKRYLLKGECLVIQNNEKLYIADDYQRDVYAFRENVYTNITVEGLLLKETLTESQVLFFSHSFKPIKELIDGLYNSYAKLISASQKNYKRSGTSKGILNIPTNYPQTPKAQEDLKNLMDIRFANFFNAESDAVLPLQNGITYDEKNKEKVSTGRDIRAFIDDIFDFVAIAFQIPVGLLKGDIADTESMVNNFLTFCIKPIAEDISDEINRKMYGKERYIERTYMKLDTSRIKVVNIKDIASSLDILTRIGANTINDSLRTLDREQINESWANERFMTKNYELVKNFKQVKGGE